MKRILRNKGDVAITSALLMPFILMLLFMIVDYAYMANQKMAIQRSADSATLSMVSMAVVHEKVTTDKMGIIKEPIEKAGQRVCEITEEYYNHGIEQLQKDLVSTQYDVSYFENKYLYDNLMNASDEESKITRKQLENGIVRLKFVGYVEGFFSRFAGLNLKISVPIDSTATCVSTLVKTDGD